MPKNAIWTQRWDDTAPRWSWGVWFTIVLAEASKVRQSLSDYRLEVIIWLLIYQVYQEAGQSIADELIERQLRQVARYEAFLLLGFLGGAEIWRGFPLRFKV